MYITLRPIEAAAIPGFVAYGASRTARSHRDLVDLHYFFTGPRDSALALSAAAMLLPHDRNNPGFGAGYGVGGSSHGAFINSSRMEQLFRDLLRRLNLGDAFVALHFGPFGRVDFHLILLNLDRDARRRFPGIATAEREIRHRLRDLTSELNRERLDAGEFSVGNRRKKGGRFFFIEPEEISPALPPPEPVLPPVPADPVLPPTTAALPPADAEDAEDGNEPTAAAAAEPASPALPAPVNTTATPENPSVPPAAVVTLLAPPISTPASSAPAPSKSTPPPAPPAAPAPIPPLPPPPRLASPAPPTATPAPVARSLPLPSRSPAGPAPSSPTAAANQAPRPALPTEMAWRTLVHRSAEEDALTRRKEEAEKAEKLLRQRHCKMREQIDHWIALVKVALQEEEEKEEADKDRNRFAELAKEAENYAQRLRVLLFQPEQPPACSANEAQAFLKSYARSHLQVSDAIDNFFDCLNVIRYLPGPDNDPPPPQKVAKDRA